MSELAISIFVAIFMEWKRKGHIGLEKRLYWLE